MTNRLLLISTTWFNSLAFPQTWHNSKYQGNNSIFICPMLEYPCSTAQSLKDKLAML
jgi:hypothetical protein